MAIKAIHASYLRSWMNYPKVIINGVYSFDSYKLMSFDSYKLMSFSCDKGAKVAIYALAGMSSQDVLLRLVESYIAYADDKRDSEIVDESDDLGDIEPIRDIKWSTVVIDSIKRRQDAKTRDDDIPF